ncbi:DMT family transporter [Hwanghaeella sp.]|uniref:DMT family transporter n=1 Tax=Hwanghaeella sp. TaxID=2605943 RepID=UPI003CCB828C
MSQSAIIERQNHVVAGIAYMLCGMLILTGMDVVVKIIVQADVHPVQVLFVRGWIVLAIMFAVLPMFGGLPALKPVRPYALVVRGAIGFLAPFSFFSALKTVPLADATVVFFAAPLLMTGLSPLVLKEKVGPYRWAAVIVGFLGVVVAVNPSAKGLDPMLFMVFLALLAYSALALMGRWLGSTETTFRLVFYFNLGILVVSSVFVAFVWQPIDLETFGGLVAISIMALVGHVLLTKAFVLAPLSIVSPFEYSALLWAAILGYLVFGDVPANTVWVGGAIIAASGMFILYREARLARKPKAEPPPA